MTSIRLNIVIAGVLVALAVPAAASARPVRHTFDRTYPVASRLCQRAERGKLPPKLAASAGQVNAACATLHASFTVAQTTFGATVAPLRAQARAAIMQARETCRVARQTHDRAACIAARRQARTTLSGLRVQLRTAIRAYRNAIEASRRTFWSTIRSLRGGSGITPDKPTSSTPPGTPSLPSGP
jgi:hypothetical protein